LRRSGSFSRWLRTISLTITFSTIFSAMTWAFSMRRAGGQHLLGLLVILDQRAGQRLATASIRRGKAHWP
jgi:hypothetical protein